MDVVGIDLASYSSSRQCVIHHPMAPCWLTLVLKIRPTTSMTLAATRGHHKTQETANNLFFMTLTSVSLAQVELCVC